MKAIVANKLQYRIAELKKEIAEMQLKIIETNKLLSSVTNNLNKQRILVNINEYQRIVRNKTKMLNKLEEMTITLQPTSKTN